MTRTDDWNAGAEAMREAAAKEVLSAQGRWPMGTTQANAAHDVALSRLAELVEALPLPPAPPEVAEAKAESSAVSPRQEELPVWDRRFRQEATWPYSCPVCKAINPHGYFRCYRPDCPNGIAPR